MDGKVLLSSYLFLPTTSPLLTPNRIPMVMGYPFPQAFDLDQSGWWVVVDNNRPPPPDDVIN